MADRPDAKALIDEARRLYVVICVKGHDERYGVLFGELRTLLPALADELAHTIERRLKPAESLNGWLTRSLSQILEKHGVEPHTDPATLCIDVHALLLKTERERDDADRVNVELQKRIETLEAEAKQSLFSYQSAIVALSDELIAEREAHALTREQAKAIHADGDVARAERDAIKKAAQDFALAVEMAREIHWADAATYEAFCKAKAALRKALG